METIAVISLCIIMFTPCLIVGLILYADSRIVNLTKFEMKLKSIDSIQWVQIWGIISLSAGLIGAITIRIIELTIK